MMRAIALLSCGLASAVAHAEPATPAPAADSASYDFAPLGEAAGRFGFASVPVLIGHGRKP